MTALLTILENAAPAAAAAAASGAAAAVPAVQSSLGKPTAASIGFFFVIVVFRL